jgi:hypothetical protein
MSHLDALSVLMIFTGCVFLCCLGLIKLIRDLSTTSVHASPQMPRMPHSCNSPQGHANGTAAYQSNPAHMSELE